MFAITANAQESFYLLADKIIKNDKEKLILAQGNVEILVAFKALSCFKAQWFKHYMLQGSR